LELTKDFMSTDIVIGAILAPFGVKGWVKIRSYTDPVDNILGYSAWIIAGERKIAICEGRYQGGNLIARLDGIDDRDAAAAFRGFEIFADRSSFPPAKPGEYYWADLIGLVVRNTQGADLGTVASMMATGANDVMVVKGDRERLVPFVIGHFVREINLDERYILVEWDEDF
jgi:16S rRNA processing protein RimM